MITRARTSPLLLALPLAIVVLILISQSASAQSDAQPDARRTATVGATATATVKAIDAQGRTVTLETPDGNTAVVRCGPDVVNFDQIAVGDRVRATVIGQLVVGVAKPGAAAEGQERAIARAPKGAKPGVMITDTVSRSARIESIDATARTVTVLGADGKPWKHKVSPHVDLAGIKSGDDVVVKVTRGLALVVEKPDAEAELTSGSVEPARGAAAMEAATRTATVEAVDPDARVVTLKNADGEAHQIHLGEECINFDQIRVGDRVIATLAEEHAIAVGKPGTLPANDGAGTMIMRAPPGSKPRVLVTDLAEITARIDAIDRANRSVKLTPAGGKSRTIKVGPGVNLDALNPGDEVAVRCTQALAIVVESP
jgi:Cu/Ag efflux protein CusF